jgi:hypothetical protein
MGKDGYKVKKNNRDYKNHLADKEKVKREIKHMMDSENVFDLCYSTHEELDDLVNKICAYYTQEDHKNAIQNGWKPTFSIKNMVIQSLLNQDIEISDLSLYDDNFNKKGKYFKAMTHADRALESLKEVLGETQGNIDAPCQKVDDLMKNYQLGDKQKKMLMELCKAESQIATLTWALESTVSSIAIMVCDICKNIKSVIQNIIELVTSIFSPSKEPHANKYPVSGTQTMQPHQDLIIASR